MDLWIRWNGELIWVERSRFSNDPAIGRAFLEAAGAVDLGFQPRNRPEIGYYIHGDRFTATPFPTEPITYRLREPTAL